MLTQRELKNFLAYDPKTGIFTWKISKYWGRPVGSVAGSAMSIGYVAIGLCGKRYTAHRLAWLYMTGGWPAFDVDHVNGDRADNRWENLREATRAENVRSQTLRPLNTSGYKGVSWLAKNKKWVAHIKTASRMRYLGSFENIVDAAKAYDVAAVKLFGNFAKTNSMLGLL